MTEQTRERKYPKWYRADDELLVFMDGPREREWMYRSRFDALAALAQVEHERLGVEDLFDRTVGYQPTGANPVPHPKDDRIFGTPMGWVQ